MCMHDWKVLLPSKIHFDFEEFTGKEEQPGAPCCHQSIVTGRLLERLALCGRGGCHLHLTCIPLISDGG